MKNPLSDYYIDKRCLLNFASLLLISLPLVVIANGDKLYQATIGVYKVGNEAQLLSLVASGFIGLTGTCYLQSLKKRINDDYYQ